MVSLDINLSSTNNGRLTDSNQETGPSPGPAPGPAPGPGPNPDAESNEIEVVQQYESEDEDEVNAANVDEISKEATFGHNFEIDISKIYPRKKRQKKNSILDIKGTNEKCFLFCVAAGLMHNDFEEKASKENPKNYENFIDKEFDISGIDFPIKISQIEQFVKQNNRHRLSINIYTVFDGQVKTVKSNITHENNENPNVIDLLAVFPHSTENASSSLQDGHFMLITDPCKFFFTRKQKSIIRPNRLRHHIICPNCKMVFSNQTSTKYKNHKHFCSNQYGQVQDMPSKDYRLSFGKLNIFCTQNVSLNVNFKMCPCSVYPGWKQTPTHIVFLIKKCRWS